MIVTEEHTPEYKRGYEEGHEHGWQSSTEISGKLLKFLVILGMAGGAFIGFAIGRVT